MGPTTPFVTGSGAHFVGNEGLYLAKLNTIFHQSKFFPGNFWGPISLPRIRYTFLKVAPPKTTVIFRYEFDPVLKTK